MAKLSYDMPPPALICVTIREEGMATRLMGSDPKPDPAMPTGVCNRLD
jgi:hypothetical protein